MKRGTPEHPKVYTLAAVLNVARWGAVGIIECLWHFGQKYAQAGDVGKHTDEAIARAIGWDDNAATLISGLCAAAWLDRCHCHRLRIHDWPEHTDQTLQRYLRERNQWFLSCYGDASAVLAPSELPCLAVPSLAKPEPLLPAKPRLAESRETAQRYLACFNAVFGRQVGLTPKIEARVAARIADKYRPWQIVAVPVLVDAQGLPADMRRTIQADVPLRDGKHPRTASDGKTYGATDWLERALGKLDQTVLDERLAEIASRFEVLDQLMQCNVSVRKASGF